MNLKLFLITLILTSYSIDNESKIIIKDYKSYHDFLNSENNSFTSIEINGALIEQNDGINFKNDSFFNKVANCSSLQILIANGCNLKDIPNQILNLKQLVKLDLDANKIKKVDTSIYRLYSIKDIYLNYNLIENIDFLNSNFKGFSNIRTLSFCNNKIYSIPKSINKFQTLKSIFLIDNYIKEIPCELSTMDYLTLNISSVYVSVDSLPCCFARNFNDFWIHANFKSKNLSSCFKEVNQSTKWKWNFRINGVRYMKKD